MVRSLLKKYYPFFPVIGLVLYLVVFSFTAAQYEGGSINVPEDQGYSFFHNFLCDVTASSIHGGEVNDARALGIVAHLLLSFSMIAFFYLLPEIFPFRNKNTQLIRRYGMLTMTVFILMFTRHHDLIVTITGILGTVALLPFFIELHKQSWSGLKRLAYACYALSIIVFFIFQTKWGFYYLPFLQKIAFIIDAWWVIWVSLVVWKKNQLRPVTVENS